MDEYGSLSHTRRDCKYHVVFIQNGDSLLNGGAGQFSQSFTATGTPGQFE